MSSQPEISATERIDAAAALASSQPGDVLAEGFEHFVRHYYAGVSDEDLLEREPTELCGAARAHLNFAENRAAGRPALRVYNPERATDGWQSSRTVIEIVNDDMPFLVDSVRMLCDERGLTTYLIIHPQVAARRAADGALLELHCGAPDGAAAESLLHVEIARLSEPGDRDALATAIRAVLDDVRAAVQDWQAMRERLAAVIAQFEGAPPPLSDAELNEAVAFLKWIGEHHFTFLGYCEYALDAGPEGDILSAIDGTALGLFRGKVGGVSQSFASLPSDLRRLAREPHVLILTKANTRSTVHRPGHLDYIGVKRFDADGNAIGEYRFLGLYTSAAYTQNPRTIPVLRQKISRVMDRSGFRGNSHDGKNLLNILESFPRDLLVQIGDEALFDTALGTLKLPERRRVRLFVHPDRYRRFVSCIVYVPRDRFNTNIRKNIQRFLGDALNASLADFNVNVSESSLARLYYVYRVQDTGLPVYDIPTLQAQLEELSASWTDQLQGALIERFGETRGLALMGRYGNAFRADYRQTYSTQTAVHDIETMETLDQGSGEIAMSLYQPRDENDNPLRFKLFHADYPIPLFETLPMLESMGLRTEDEHPSRIDRADASQVWLHDFGMDHSEGADFDIEPNRTKFIDAFRQIWRGEVENDRFNGLVLRAGLAWREIVVLRACAKYLRQAGSKFSQGYIARALLSNPTLARLLFAMFERRFDPDRDPSSRDISDLDAAFDSGLDAVPNLDEDRILRSLRGLIMAMLRTNYYQFDGNGALKNHVSFKFDPRRIAELPEPRPMYEIFVYSPRVEGVHLRGGRIARGGLRWSDRREDFRTEILGLVKAQMVKNAVIVPMGSKGGFYPKRLPDGDRQAIQAEGIACYEVFIRGLLDITDNLVDGEVVAAPRTVRYDDDDTYLVVAADKGTASFSDIANGIAIEYGFWLGDAFASGGSNGYDHKAMGITARGAWESVKRHFRELGSDTQTTDFTVVGIGDMAGDVFGNGMLLSQHICLVGAFNHQHIFLDPAPDPARSHSERKRLFDLPRSSWDDYDRSLISAGGGIWSRSAKSIPLAAEARSLLGIERSALSPNELIQALLRAPVDLLWNGGIGTYVKSSEEDHAEVGDRSNDALRIDADELRCRVIGEGGNLGLTQRARIEFAALGGRVNSDAIDNSAGVDCSDHEVNIKILLTELSLDGTLDKDARNALLAAMTDEVGTLVLRNNYLQTQALSIAEFDAVAMLEQHAHFAEHMEQDGELDQALEFLPDAEEIKQRDVNEAGYTAPELAVLLAYAKIGLYPELLDSELPGDAYLEQDLLRYFPAPLVERYAARIPRHRLAREIVSTLLANEIVNRCGITFTFRLAEVSGAASEGIARAYLIARDVFELPALWADIEALDNVVPAAAQTQALIETQKLTERAAQWLLRNRPQPLDVAANVAFFGPDARLLAEQLTTVIPATLTARLDALVEQRVALGLPRGMAERLASFDALFAVFDIAEVAAAASLPVTDVARLYFELGALLDLEWVRDGIAALPQDTHWQLLARAALREDLYAQGRAITANLVATATTPDEAAIPAWREAVARPLEHWHEVLAELQEAGRPEFAMLSVAVRELRSIRVRGETIV